MAEKSYLLNELQLTHINFDSIDSTQAYCINKLESITKLIDEDHIYCVTASTQTKGVGKYGAQWFSPNGNLYSTYVVKMPITKHNLELVQSAAVAVSVCLGQFGLDTEIKWLNDLLLDGKKVSGILCDSINLNDQIYTVIGIGVNIACSPNLEWTTSIYEARKIKLDIEHLVACIGQNLHKYIVRGNYSEVKKLYQSRMAYRGTEMPFIAQGSRKIGKILGLSHSGELEINTDSEVFTYSDCKIEYPQ